jgi:hypothetical protein
VPTKKTVSPPPWDIAASGPGRVRAWAAGQAAALHMDFDDNPGRRGLDGVSWEVGHPRARFAC